MLSPVLGLCQFMLILGVGLALERRLKIATPSFGYKFAISFGLGEIFVSCFLLAAGILGGLRA